MSDPHHDSVQAIVWREDALQLLDQRLLPQQETYLTLTEVAEVAAAIRDMVVRGAPAIGITAAYGLVLAARERYRENPDDWTVALGQDAALLLAARPTAVNLKWALARLQARVKAGIDGDPEPVLLVEAQAIHAEDVAANRHMGALGAALLSPHSGVLTHCNTGALATGGYGTALGVIRAGVAVGTIERVYADETRPWLQGARLTAWELLQDDIPVTLIADGAAALLMQQGQVHWLIVGADRIAANGDVANKIGTYTAALVARHHGVKVMVVAPTSTVDLDTPDGAAIPIEQRDAAELLRIAGAPIAPPDADAWNPVFDITPAALIDAIVTEKGVVQAPDTAKLRAMMASDSPAIATANA